MTARRTYTEARRYSAQVMKWRLAVYGCPNMTNGCRVLLLRMSDDMAADRRVSVPRRVLAADLDVAPARITEWIKAARDLGFLDLVAAGKPGQTSEYQGLYPDQKGTPERTSKGTREPTKLGVRGGVPKTAAEGYALHPTQEVVTSAENGESRLRRLPERGFQGDGDHGLRVDGALDSSPVCPHGIPGGAMRHAWVKDRKPACPECARELADNEGRANFA